MSFNGCHSFGRSAYLVPRSKANCLVRLIIDHFLANQSIQSRSAVIPEINATTQFLRSKAFYISLDLTYAYVSLSIDKESKKLTTFFEASIFYKCLQYNSSFLSLNVIRMVI